MEVACPALAAEAEAGAALLEPLAEVAVAVEEVELSLVLVVVAAAEVAVELQHHYYSTLFLMKCQHYLPH